MNTALLKQEIQYRSARSGGRGGQNVNKVETKVEARLDVGASNALNEAEKALVFEKLSNTVSNEGILILTHQTERSQLLNKQKVEEKLLKRVEKALVVPKKRKRVPVPAAVKAARAREKALRSELKESRKKIRIDG